MIVYNNANSAHCQKQLCSYWYHCMCSDHQRQHHRNGDEDARPPAADADPYAELRNIGADNAAHLYSALNNVPTHNHTYANVSP